MRYRAFQVISSGQFTNALMSVAGDEFSVPAESHQNDIAVALGVPVSDLRVVEGDQDPRGAGPYLSLPVAPPGPEEIRRERLQALRDKGVTRTPAESDEALQILLEQAI